MTGGLLSEVQIYRNVGHVPTIMWSYMTGGLLSEIQIYRNVGLCSY